jgi:hypothetical protein
MTGPYVNKTIYDLPSTTAAAGDYILVGKADNSGLAKSLYAALTGPTGLAGPTGPTGPSLLTNVPGATSSTGITGNYAVGGGYFYFYDGTQWRRIAGASF